MEEDMNDFEGAEENPFSAPLDFEEEDTVVPGVVMEEGGEEPATDSAEEAPKPARPRKKRSSRSGRSQRAIVAGALAKYQELAVADPGDLEVLAGLMGVKADPAVVATELAIGNKPDTRAIDDLFAMADAENAYVAMVKAINLQETRERFVAAARLAGVDAKRRAKPVILAQQLAEAAQNMSHEEIERLRAPLRLAG